MYMEIRYVNVCTYILYSKKGTQAKKGAIFLPLSYQPTKANPPRLLKTASTSDEENRYRLVQNDE